MNAWSNFAAKMSAAFRRSRGTQKSSALGLSPAMQAEVIEFLRYWIPPPAADTYRRMILDDPADWYLAPHFAGGVVVKHFLRGNGITERALGVASLEPLWPQLMREAVLEMFGQKAPDSRFPTLKKAGLAFRSGR